MVENGGASSGKGLHMTGEDRDRLTRIETTVDLLKVELLGNGQPGRCAYHSQRLRSLERWRWLMVGAGTVVGFFGGLAMKLLAR